MPVTEPTQEQRRMAMLCGFHPNEEASWPIDILDKLIKAENESDQELMRQMRNLLPPF